MAKRKNKSTSSDVASTAAKLLSSPRTSEVTKRVAGSALAQTVPSKPTKVRTAERPKQSFKAGKDL
jgi:hypothetical protein